MNRPELLLAGHIGRPHGIHGEVHVVRISDDSSRFQPGAELIHANGRRLTVESSRAHGDRMLVRFAGIETRSEAEGLRGELYVSPSQLRDLGEDEFWPHDLAGCEVVLASGESVGSVDRVEPGAAQDLLVVKTPGGPRLIPAVKAIVVEVDVAARRVTIDPPEGLLDQ
jgi:16S rRNA processing protein RimM